MGRVMQILAELGISLRADVPDEVEDTLSALKTKGVKAVFTQKAHIVRRPHRAWRDRPGRTGRRMSVLELQVLSSNELQAVVRRN